MGRTLQKKKNKSSTPRARQKPKSKKLNLQSNPFIAANWDRKQTVSQNYRRLGITPRLNAPTGGTEKRTSSTPALATLNDAQGAKHNTLAITSRLPKKLEPGLARIERDPETGAIVRVLSDTLGSSNDNPLNDSLNEITELRQDNSRISYSERGIIKELEEQASVEVKKRPRQQSRREEDWIAQLVEKYGDNYMGMVRDRKLNPYQQSEGDLARRVRRWKARQGIGGD